MDRLSMMEAKMWITDRYPSGGALHIVIDDENLDDGSIYWCLKNSIPEIEDETERKVFYTFAVALLNLSESERETLCRHR